MLYALGSNSSGQLGTNTTEDAHSPQICHLPQNFPYTSILSISAGGNHTLINTPGQIFAAGDISNGRYPIVHIYTQAKLEDAHRYRLSSVSAQFCAATWEASIIVDDIQRVLTCGTGRRGELGLGEGVTIAEKPTVIKNFPPDDDDNEDDNVFIADLSAGMSHTVCLLANGAAYGWGSGRKGQLGQPAHNCWTPRKIAGIPFEPHRAVCGKDFTYLTGPPSSGSHVVLGSSNDRWGVISQAPVSLPPWKDIGASWGSVFVLLETGALLSWGRNDRGQLGPADLPKLAQIAVGSEHVVALTEDGKVIAWGWGEHGNCGQPVDEDGDVKGRWNEIRVPGTVVGVGAGCATTFIITEDE
jgi:protein ATS1